MSVMRTRFDGSRAENINISRHVDVDTVLGVEGERNG